jgi:hypothetical protein
MNEIQRAEMEVNRSEIQFDQAMDHLRELLDETGQKITDTVENVRDTIQKPKKVFFENLGRAINGGYRGYAMGRSLSSHLINSTRQAVNPAVQAIKNDRRAQIALGATVLGTLTVLFMQRRKPRIELEEIDEPLSLLGKELSLKRALEDDDVIVFVGKQGSQAA